MSRKRKRTFNKIKVFFLLVICSLVTMTGVVVWTVKARVEPNLETVGGIRARVVVQQIVNKAVNEQLRAAEGMNEILIRKTDENGQMEVLQANTQAMNLLMTDISKELQVQYAERKEDVYYVPLGVLLGNRILSQARPEIRLRIRLISVSDIDFKTEFESQGINQTKYKVHMELTSEVKVLAPFTEETFEVSTSVLIAEAIILGSVPGSYVNVPEEDILDVTTE